MIYGCAGFLYVYRKGYTYRCRDTWKADRHAREEEIHLRWMSVHVHG